MSKGNGILQKLQRQADDLMAKFEYLDFTSNDEIIRWIGAMAEVNDDQRVKFDVNKILEKLNELGFSKDALNSKVDNNNKEQVSKSYIELAYKTFETTKRIPRVVSIYATNYLRQFVDPNTDFITYYNYWLYYDSKYKSQEIEAPKNDEQEETIDPNKANKMNDLIIRLENTAKPPIPTQENLAPISLVSKVKPLNPSIDTLNEIIDLHPEIQEAIEGIVKSIANDDLIKTIYQGTVKIFKNFEQVFYAVKKTLNQNKITIVIPGQGIQEVTFDGKEEKYERIQGPLDLIIRSRFNSNGDKEVYSVFFSEQTWDTYSDILIEEGRKNQTQEFGLKTEDYKNPIIKEAIFSAPKGKELAKYLQLYKDRQAKTPERIASIINETKEIYEINPKTGKYKNISNLKKPEVGLEEFEEKAKRGNSIPQITNSEWDAYFNDSNFQIPSEIQKIIEVITKLENKDKDKDEEVK